MKYILLIYFKEWLEIIRDKRTLLMMLVIPVVLTPLVMIGIGRFAFNVAKEQAVKPVKVLATEGSKEKYEELIFKYYKESDVGKLLTLAESGIPGLKNVGDSSLELPKKPEDLEQFARAIRKVLDEEFIEKSLTNMGELSGSSPSTEVPFELGAMNDFATVLVQGYVLIDFIELEDLEEYQDQEETEVPALLADFERASDIYSAFQNKEIQAVLDIKGEVNLEERTALILENITIVRDKSRPLSLQAYMRMNSSIQAMNQEFAESRINALGYNEQLLRPLRVTKEGDIATSSDFIVAIIGGILPYLIITFAFLGGIHPAIDIGSGEKERQTLETLLATPVSRVHVALGKFLVIFTTSATAALAGFASMAFSFFYFAPPVLTSQIDLNLSASQFIHLLLLCIPPAAAFAGLFLAISIYSRSFKEAQNYLSPLPIFLIIPAGAAMIPGIELDAYTSLIPLVNISLLSKEILTGYWENLYFVTTFLSCILLAALCLAFCIFQFNREETLFRS